MDCQNCGASNLPTQKFCGGCGSKLALTCQACGAERAAAQKFCIACGARHSETLTAADTPSPPSVAPAQLPAMPDQGLAMKISIESIRFNEEDDYELISKEIEPDFDEAVTFLRTHQNVLFGLDPSDYDPQLHFKYLAIQWGPLDASDKYENQIFFHFSAATQRLFSMKSRIDVSAYGDFENDKFEDTFNSVSFEFAESILKEIVESDGTFSLNELLKALGKKTREERKKCELAVTDFVNSVEISNFFSMNNVPAKKLTNAKKIHSNALRNDEKILALYDATIFGSAEDGFLLTDRAIHFKNIVMDPITVPFDTIDKVTSKKNDIFVNAHEIQVGSSESDKLNPAVVVVLNSLKRVFQSD